MRITIGLTFAISALLSLVVDMSQAQAVPPLSELKVTVLDEIGAVIPDSEVAITSHSGTIVLHTDRAGSVTAKLPDSRYAVVVFRQGFVRSRIPDVRVVAPRPEMLRIVLKMDRTPIVDGVDGIWGPQTSTSDLRGVLGSDPARVPSRPSVIRKRSWQCLYLWKCTPRSSELPDHAANRE